MKIAGIVAEYDPFHNGHADHIALTCDRAHGAGATHIVAVMSGHFVQRGEPAAFPRADRVRAALAGGVDLVLELPVPWVLSSAEGFAFGAVSLLHALGCVDTVSFGSECGDIAALREAAEILDTPACIQATQFYMSEGRSAAESMQKALNERGGKRLAALLDTPNNMLGIEYIKAIRRIGSPMDTFTVARRGAGHDDTFPTGAYASASFLRRLAREGRFANAAPFMPPESFAACAGALDGRRAPADPAAMERAVLLKLRRAAADRLAAVAGMTEGLENRLQNAANEATGWGDFFERAKTKRYPLTRLNRAVWCAMLGIPSGWSGQTPPYLRLLGMTKKGEEILSAARSSAALPILSRATQGDSLDGFARQVWNVTCQAAEWYGLMTPVPLPHGTEYTEKMIKV